MKRTIANRLPFRLRATALCILALPVGLFAQTYPLSENTWSNPEFVDRFLGSYGFDMEKTPDISRVEAELFRAVAKAAKTDAAEAARLLREALAPESSGAVDFALANFLLQLGDRGQAVEAYRTAIRKFPNFGRAYKNLGLAHIQSGDYRSALPPLIKALEILGGDGGLYGLIGYCHLNLENHGPALDAYRFALLHQPDSRDWRLGKLKALQSLGRYLEVAGILQSYIAESPSEPEFWLQQANAFIAQKKFARAAANFEVAQMLGAADAEMLLLLGDIYVNLDVPALAIDPYSRAMDTGEVAPGKALDLAKTLRRRLEPMELKAFLDKMEAAYGQGFSGDRELTFLSLKAANALARGETDAAMDALASVVARDPLNGSALITLGGYHYDQGDLVKALDYYSRAEKVEEFKVEALLGSARSLVKQGEYREAIIRLSEARDLSDQPAIAKYIDTLERYVN